MLGKRSNYLDHPLGRCAQMLKGEFDRSISTPLSDLSVLSPQESPRSAQASLRSFAVDLKAVIRPLDCHHSPQLLVRLLRLK